MKIQEINKEPTCDFDERSSINSIRSEPLTNINEKSYCFCEWNFFTSSFPTLPTKKFVSYKTNVNHIDDTCCMDLLDLLDYDPKN